jgi:uncharacterized protein
MLAVTTLDGLGFLRVLAAGTYFLKKYRTVLNDLNVFPVPDGDTGSNLYLTLRAALFAARPVCEDPLHVVAAAAAHGALLGARGNSGVIFSQMLRGFSEAVRGRERLTTPEVAAAMRQAVTAARAALLVPAEGTMISVAGAAATEACEVAEGEPEFYRFGAAIVRAASDALERTPEELPILREAGVVDSGGAGFLYFLEGILRFLPETGERVTAYPRRARRGHVFTPQRAVEENRFCTEFVLRDVAIESHALADRLKSTGNSLLVAGVPPMLRVHIHTDSPQHVASVARELGTIDRWKVDDMQHQHGELVVDAPKRVFSIMAVVPGLGFDRIARELGADETIVSSTGNPSADELLSSIERSIAQEVIVLPNDPSLIPAVHAAAAESGKHVIVAPTRDVAAGLALLVAFGGRIEDGPVPQPGELMEAAARVQSATVTFNGGVNPETIERVLEDAAVRLSSGGSGLLTLYYGGSRKEADAERAARAIRERLPKVEVEWFFGGQRTSEYVVSFER